MVNTPAPDAVHAPQLNARKRKSPPRTDAGHSSSDDDDDEVTQPRTPPGPSAFGLHDIHRAPRRKLSIDVAAAAAAAAQCYREEPKASSSSPRTSSASASSSARPFKFLRLSVSAPPSPSISSEKQKRKIRKDQASRRRLYRLYNKRIPSPYSSPTFRFPPPGLSFNSPSPAHTLAHPTAPSNASLPFASPSSLSTPVPSPTIPSASSSFTRAHPPAHPSHASSSSSPGSGPSRGCLHQSCVAFRFASMMDGVHLSSPIAPHSSPVHGSIRAGPIYVPPILPPINRYTLQELDLDAIMKNPQLRHDLLFDVGLQFRPTDSKRKRETTEMYWCAILSELDEGCPCVSFNDTRCLRRHVCHCASSSRVPTKAHLPFEDTLPIRVPSRIRPLIEELREVILAVVLPPPPPIPVRSTAPGAGSGSMNAGLRPRRLSASDASSVAWLHEAFDVPLVEQQLRHGVFDLGKLFVAIGDLLRRHCAPARDTMVAKMVEFAAECGPGKAGSMREALSAIRTCFELLELMRLDLANHLLSHLRPHLLASAPQFELNLFSRRHTPDVSITRRWFSAAYARVSASRELHSALGGAGGLLPAPEQVRALPPVHKIVAALLPALVDLVLFPPSPASATLPPSPTTTPVTKGHHAHAHAHAHALAPALQPGYPETLCLDHARLLMLASDAADVAATFMLLALVRQFVFAAGRNGSSGARLSDADLTQIRREMAAVGPARPGLCFCKDYSLGKEEGTGSASSSVQTWRTQMGSLILHIAQKIEGATQPPSPSSSSTSASTSSSAPPSATSSSPSSAKFTPPNPELITSLTSWCATHMRAGSAVAGVFRRKLATAVLKAVIPQFFALWNAGVHQQQQQQQNQNPFGAAASTTKSKSNAKSTNRSADSMSESDEEDDDDTAPPPTSPTSPAQTTTATPTPTVKTGLEPLSADIRVLAERLAKLAVLHLRVYFPFYEQNAFLTTSNTSTSTSSSSSSST